MKFTHFVATVAVAMSTPVFAQSVRTVIPIGYTRDYIKPINDIEIPHVTEEINRFQQKHSGSNVLCVPIPGYKFTTRSVDITRGSYEEEDNLIRMDLLVQHGLFKKTTIKNGARYLATPTGTKLMTSDKCISAPGVEKFAGEPALVYAHTEFGGYISGWRTTVGQQERQLRYYRRMADVAEFAKDTELRRAWHQPGLAEIDETEYCISYYISSNGVEVNSNGKCLMQSSH